MVLAQKMTHPPISCEKSFESSYWRVGTFTKMIPSLWTIVNKHKDNQLRASLENEVMRKGER